MFLNKKITSFFIVMSISILFITITGLLSEKQLSSHILNERSEEELFAGKDFIKTQQGKEIAEFIERCKRLPEENCTKQDVENVMYKNIIKNSRMYNTHF